MSIRCTLSDPSRFSRCRDLQLQRNINQTPQIQGGVAILPNHRNFPTNLTNQWRRLQLTLTNYLPPYFCIYVQAIQAFMQDVRVSTCRPKITVKDREKQYPGILHESRGEIFCTACNIVVEHKRKSSIDKHFATTKQNCRTAGWTSDCQRGKNQESIIHRTIAQCFCTFN